jgi:uncharacterized protein YbjT (DUF2867 family)
VRIAIAGATGSIGAPTAAALAARGHEVRALSRHADEYPVDLTTGEGLGAALEGCEVLIDASNAGPAEKPARAVLIEGGKRLLAAARDAGVRHHVCISIVGIEQIPLPYYRVKVEQEQLVVDSGLPYSIVRATQFHSLVAYLFESAARFWVVPGGRAKLQPVDPGDVAGVLADVAEGDPIGGRTTVAGPEVAELGSLAREWKRATGRRVLVGPAPFPPRLGRPLRAGALTDPAAEHRGTVGFPEWLRRSAPRT